MLSTSEIVSVQLEEFDSGERQWRHPFEAWLSHSKEKFASGTFRDAYLVTALCKLGPGKFVLKTLRKIKFKK